MRTVLITGILGFTGRYAAEQLRNEGYRVYGMAFDGASPDDGIYQCDLMDRQGLVSVVEKVKPDYVMHLAAIAFVAHGDVDAIYRTNVVGTRNLLEALASSSHRVRHILLASSANVYGNTPVDPLTERVVPAPANDYAVSKAAMEYMARLWIPQLPITFVRPFNYTGVGQSLDFLLPKIVDHFKRRAQVVELGNIDVARDFSDVRVVVDAYSKLLNIEPRGDVFNACSGNAFALQEIIEMMERIAGYKIRVEVNPAFVRSGEVKFLRGSNKKLLDRIGKLDVIPMEETLRWMYES